MRSILNTEVQKWGFFIIYLFKAESLDLQNHSGTHLVPNGKDRLIAFGQDMETKLLTEVRELVFDLLFHPAFLVQIIRLCHSITSGWKQSTNPDWLSRSDALNRMNYVILKLFV